MYNKKFFKFLIPVVAVLTLMASSCKKNDYLTDTGVHDPVTPLSNYDYLAKNQLHQFDTLLQMIDRFDLKQQVNEAATFFAPTDYSILRAITGRLTVKQQIDPSASFTLDSLLRVVTGDSLRQYMFKETITLGETPEFQARPYTSLAGTTNGAIKVLQNAAPYTDRTSATTYLLFFVKVRGAVDIPGVTPPPNEIDVSVLCQTTGIKTSNGTTTLHVLNNNHIFSAF